MRLVLALALVGAATPAAAQFVTQPGPPRTGVPPIAGGIAAAGPAREVDRARGRIEDARDDRRLSRREARRYRREATAIDGLGERFGRDGLSAGERQELELRARVLADQATLAGRNKPAGK